LLRRTSAHELSEFLQRQPHEAINVNPPIRIREAIEPMRFPAFITAPVPDIADAENSQ
jgi:hypothetical protein